MLLLSSKQIRAMTMHVPSNILKKIKASLLRQYRLHVVKDEFAIAVDKWFKDAGDETLRLEYPLTPDSVVVDLGGYKGDFAAAIHMKYGCHVYLFEPVKRFYSECVRRFDGNAKIKCFNYGLSSQNGTFLISDEDNGSSLVKSTTSGNCERVVVRSFQEAIAELDLPQIDLLKVNVEGAEFRILPHILSTGLIGKIRYLQVQFHNFFPNANTLRDDIRKTLSKTHVEQWNYPFVWESWARKQR